MRVPFEVFDKAAFLEDIKQVSDRERKTHSWGYSSREHPSKQHAHILIDFRREKLVRIKITYHSFGSEDTPTNAPYLEECGQWLGKFLRAEEIPAEVEALYRFDSQYSPIMGLPFPLPTARKELRGSKVKGISVLPPRKMNIKEAIIQRVGNGFTIFITTKESMRIKDFDLDAELSKLAGSVMMFVYRLGDAE